MDGYAFRPASQMCGNLFYPVRLRFYGGTVAAVMPATARLHHWSYWATWFMLTMEGRCGGGIACQDSFMFRMNGMPRAQGCAGAAKHVLWRLILDFLGNCSCVALPPASLQSCLVRSWKAIPPPQLQYQCSSTIRNHWPMLKHIAEGVRYLSSGP